MNLNVHVETTVPYANRNNENIQIHRTLSGDSGWHTCTCKDGSTFECQSNQGDGAACCDRSMPAICNEGDKTANVDMSDFKFAMNHGFRADSPTGGWHTCTCEDGSTYQCQSNRGDGAVCCGRSMPAICGEDNVPQTAEPDSGVTGAWHTCTCTDGTTYQCQSNRGDGAACCGRSMPALCPDSAAPALTLADATDTALKDLAASLTVTGGWHTCTCEDETTYQCQSNRGDRNKCCMRSMPALCGDGNYDLSPWTEEPMPEDKASEWHTCVCADETTYECKSNRGDGTECCTRSMPAICGESRQYMIGKKNVSIALGSTFKDGGAFCANNSSATTVVADPVDTCVAGSYRVDYKCVDGSDMHREVSVESKACANWDCATWCKCFDKTAVYQALGCSDKTDECKCSVSIKDTMKPWLNIAGSYETVVQADKTGTYTDAGATCEDGFDGIISNSVEVSGQVVNLKVPGEYEIIYNCKDTANNEAVEKKRKVTVKDTLAPVITLHGGSFSCDDSFDDTPTTSTSCSQGDCGQCTYTCTDSSRNSANKTAAIDCPYDPCVGKQENCRCQLCPFDDDDCVETTVVKSCQMVQNTLTCLQGARNAQGCSTPCPIATCVMPNPGCNRTYPQDRDANGCLIHLCGVDVCPVCCEALTAQCLACSAGQTVQEYCRLHPKTQGCPCPADLRICPDGTRLARTAAGCQFPPCPAPTCPEDCSDYFDGCNRCTCSDGRARCTKKFCAEPTAFVCHDDESDEPEYNCRTREVWTPEKRQWCCINERIGCCPQVRCRQPLDRCNRTWSQEVNDRGCLVYPCGVDRCAARPRTNPGIIVRDDRGIERMRTNANSTLKTFEDEGANMVNQDGRVTVRVRDDRGRPRVEMACRDGGNACLNTSTSEDVVRRRNIIKEVVDTLGAVIMSVDESGLSSLRNSRADSVVIQPVDNDKPVNTTNCADADVDVQTFEEDAYEFVLREKNEQFMACTSHKLLALVTLKNINLAGRSEYSVECWHPENYKWEFVELLHEGDTFTCPVLPDYTFEIASVAGLTYALTVPPTPQAEPPAPAPPPLTVVYGPGVATIEACIEDEITIVWNGTHDLRETETADCDSNETETSPWHSEFETTGYNKTFIGLGGRYQGETRYYMCSTHCGVGNARIEVTCKYAIDPHRHVSVNTVQSDLGIPAAIVAGVLVVIIATVLSAIFCKRKPKQSEIAEVTVTSRYADELNERLLENPLKWVP